MDSKPVNGQYVTTIMPYCARRRCAKGHTIRSVGRPKTTGKKKLRLIIDEKTNVAKKAYAWRDDSSMDYLHTRKKGECSDVMEPAQSPNRLSTGTQICCSCRFASNQRRRHNTTQHDTKNRKNQMQSPGLMNERGRGSAMLMTTTPSSDKNRR